MSSGGLRPFNAITGRELKEIILSELKRHLDADSRFANHVTYPVFSYRWALAVNAYPSEPPEFEVKVGPLTVKAPGADMPEGDAPVIEIDLGGGKDVTAPAPGGVTADAARRDAGIAVPSRQIVRGPDETRISVDVPLAEKAANQQTGPQVEKVAANVEKGGRMFGRSVTQRTKAAPEGIDVPAQAGSAPGTDDVQKIIEIEQKDAAKE